MGHEGDMVVGTCEAGWQRAVPCAVGGEGQIWRLLDQRDPGLLLLVLAQPLPLCEASLPPAGTAHQTPGTGDPLIRMGPCTSQGFSHTTPTCRKQERSRSPFLNHHPPLAAQQCRCSQGTCLPGGFQQPLLEPSLQGEPSC